eukprot:1222277-Prymnesium_polylepis.1
MSALPIALPCPRLPRHARLCAPPRSKGQVQVLQLCGGDVRRLKLGPELGRQLVELVDGREDAGAAHLQARCGLEGALESSQFCLIHAARGLLAVACHKGQRATLVEERNRAGHTPELHLEEAGTLGDDCLLRSGGERAAVNNASVLPSINRTRAFEPLDQFGLSAAHLETTFFQRCFELNNAH